MLRWLDGVWLGAWPGSARVPRAAEGWDGKSVVAGEFVGLRVVEDGLWLVHLGPFRLGHLHDRSRTIVPLEGGVTHVPGCTEWQREPCRDLGRSRRESGASGGRKASRKESPGGSCDNLDWDLRGREDERGGFRVVWDRIWRSPPAGVDHGSRPSQGQSSVVCQHPCWGRGGEMPVEGVNCLETP